MTIACTSQRGLRSALAIRLSRLPTPGRRASRTRSTGKAKRRSCGRRGPDDPGPSMSFALPRGRPEARRGGGAGDGSGSPSDVARRLRRRARPEPGEPARRGREAAPRVGPRAEELAATCTGWRAARPARDDASWRRGRREHRGDHHGTEHVRRRPRALASRPLERLVGADPPFHTPVFVLTHHPREPLEMQGGTTFHFVTEGIEAALERARRGGRGQGRRAGRGRRRRPAVPPRGAAR